MPAKSIMILTLVGMGETRKGTIYNATIKAFMRGATDFKSAEVDLLPIRTVAASGNQPAGKISFTTAETNLVACKNSLARKAGI